MYGRTRFRGFSVVTWLILVCVGVFVVQAVGVVWFRSLVVEKYFALSLEGVKEWRVWTLVTYGFLHANFLHILVNMLAIFFVGRILEGQIGGRNILKVFLFSVVLGGGMWLMISGWRGEVLVGASAGGFGLMTVFCLLYPNRLITVLLFFVIPVVMKPKWILWGMVIFELFMFVAYEIPGHTFLASSAHLGGILGGVIMYFVLIRYRLFSWKKKQKPLGKPMWYKSGGVKVDKRDRHRVKLSDSEKELLKKEMDRILDKINQKGFSSLSADERALLDRAKHWMES